MMDILESLLILCGFYALLVFGILMIHLAVTTFEYILYVRREYRRSQVELNIETTIIHRKESARVDWRQEGF